MFLSPRQAQLLFQAALEQRFAILAINADSPAALTDCLEAAREIDAPVIIETSLWQLNGRSFGAGDPALGLARYLVQLILLAGSDRYRDVPVLLHTDHIQGPVTLPLLRAAVRGLPTGVPGTVVSPSTLSLDSSRLTETENIDAIVALAHESAECGRPVTLEMEAGIDDGVTAPEVTERLLGRVEALAPGAVHLWAPGVGTRHGLTDTGGFSARAVVQHRQTAERVTGRPIGLALHGSSGLPPEALRAAVDAGVVKVNWSSESLLLRSEAARAYYPAREAEWSRSHPAWKATAMDDGVQSWIAGRYVPVVRERMRLLGGADRGRRIRARLGLEDRLASPPRENHRAGPAAEPFLR